MTLGAWRSPSEFLCANRRRDKTIHTHLARGEPRARAILDAARETLVPRTSGLAVYLAVIRAVFLPDRHRPVALYTCRWPLAFERWLASYLHSNTLVPVLSPGFYAKTCGDHGEVSPHGTALVGRARSAGDGFSVADPGPVTWSSSGVGLFLIAASGYRHLRPRRQPANFQPPLRAPAGTRVERTEELT